MMAGHVSNRERSIRELLQLGALVVGLGLLAGCGGGDGGETPPLVIASADMPYGQVGKQYRAELSVSGSEEPVRWTVKSGSLPAGLSLDPAGVISGIPLEMSAGVPVVLEARGRYNKRTQRTTTSVPIYISPADIEVSLEPSDTGLTTSQHIALRAVTNDFQGVVWTATNGAFSMDKPGYGGSTDFIAPGVPGWVTVTATSLTDPTRSVSKEFVVTDLSGVLTYHNNRERNGVNDQEYLLTPANVASPEFGKLFSCKADGPIYAQPLWVPGLEIGGRKRNVVFVATARNGLFAFDADANPCVTLWSVNLIDAAHGGEEGEIPFPAGRSPEFNYLAKDMAPDVGVTGTPVIDAEAGIIYLVTKSATFRQGEEPRVHQRLHAIDLLTGAEKPGSPVLITAKYPGKGDGGDEVTFNPLLQNQRAGLALADGVVYIAWGSHEDVLPYYGWLMGYRYDGQGFTQTAVFNVAPDNQWGGIWMSGAAPSVDEEGNLYVITGNGYFNASEPPPFNTDYSNSLIKLRVNKAATNPVEGLTVVDYFAPDGHLAMQEADHDFGSGGASVLGEVTAGSPARTVRLLIAGNKDGIMNVFDRDSLGGLGDDNVWQAIPTFGPIFATVAFWHNTIYLVPTSRPIIAFTLDLESSGKFVVKPREGEASNYPYPGATPSISASRDSNGVLWAIEGNSGCNDPSGQSTRCRPAVLHAYDAGNLKELWNSNGLPEDVAGNAVKFTVPTVANGKVYVGTRGTNTGGPIAPGDTAGQLDVYGLRPN